MSSSRHSSQSWWRELIEIMLLIGAMAILVWLSVGAAQAAPLGGC